MTFRSFTSFFIVAAFASLVAATLTSANAHRSDRLISIDASSVVGKLKNLQGDLMIINLSGINRLTYGSVPTMGTLVGFVGGSTTESLHDFQPEIFSMYPSLGVQQVEIYILPELFLGWNRTGNDGDALNNANYNWTVADQYIQKVMDIGAKASILFSSPKDSSIIRKHPQLLTQVGYMITNRYMNGANGSGFFNAIELFDFYQEPDIYNGELIDDGYDWHFKAFKAFSYGVANASSDAGVGAWSGNRVYATNASYEITDKYVTQFYRDCKEQGVPVKAATFHSVQTQFSFDPYDVVRVANNLRNNILTPAGMGDIEIWISEFFLSGIPILPSSPSALRAFYDPAFFASFTLGATMYAQDTSINTIMQWPGLGYGGNGATGFSFPGFFNKSPNGPPIPLNAARAFLLQAQLVTKTPNRLAVRGSSSDGFAVLAGRSGDMSMVQVLVNNYQLDYDIPREIAATAALAINTSTAASPVLQPNGLLNGEAFCLRSNNSVVPAPICINYPLPTIRNNTSKSYNISIQNLPWEKHQSFDVKVERVSSPSKTTTVAAFSGRGGSLSLNFSINANEQDLIIIKKHCVDLES